VNGDNQITEADRVKYKQANPEGFFGFTNSMRYKKFDLNFTLRGAFGGHVYNNFQSSTGFKQHFTNTLGNFVQNGSPSVFQTDFNNAQLFSDVFIQSADFIKLDNISLGYSLDFDKIKTRFSFTATNVFVITSYDGIDPEIPNGIDNNLFPVPRSYVLGASLTF
ncbi:MAG: SusC/RagA family TonB-linked outer membrane protein, partial [Flavobacteriaceae bacterium]|nr:SusC/RagA family TonB-linked outer membrane protein [Flavobacteriaceae bacterium]